MGGQVGPTSTPDVADDDRRHPCIVLQRVEGERLRAALCRLPGARLDTLANASALRDVVRATLGPKGRDRLLGKIQQAHETTYSGAQLATATRRLPKATAKTIADAFTGNDVVNLPPGNTAWRASNAISWIARASEDAEARLDLERLAGAVM